MTKIRLYSQMSGESLTLIYEDNGTGIPVNDKEKIFEFGYGTGTGFGLFLIRELLGYTGITITESGEPGKGANLKLLYRKVNSGRQNQDRGFFPAFFIIILVQSGLIAG